MKKLLVFLLLAISTLAQPVSNVFTNISIDNNLYVLGALSAANSYAFTTNALSLDGTTTKFVRADGTLAVPPGTGSGAFPFTLIGPGTSVSPGHVPQWADTTGTNVATSTIIIDHQTNLTVGSLYFTSGASINGDSSRTGFNPGIDTPSINAGSLDNTNAITTGSLSATTNIATAKATATNQLHLPFATASRVLLNNAQQDATNVVTTAILKGDGTAAAFADWTNTANIFTAGTSKFLREDGTMQTPGSGGGLANTVLNSSVTSALLAVDSTGTNGTAATKAMMTNAFGNFTGSTSTYLDSSGAFSTPVASPAPSPFFSKHVWFWSSSQSSGVFNSFGVGVTSASSGTGASITFVSSTATTPGYMAASTGTATNGYSYMGDAAVHLRTDKAFKVMWRGNITSTNGVQAYLGVAQLAANMITDNNFGATRRNAWIQYISQQDPHWQLLTSNNTTATNVITSVVADTLDHTFQLEYSPTGPSFTAYIDGNPVATNTLSIATTQSWLSEAAIGNITNAVSAKIQILQSYGEQDF